MCQMTLLSQFLATPFKKGSFRRELRERRAKKAACSESNSHRYTYDLTFDHRAIRIALGADGAVISLRKMSPVHPARR